MFIWSSFVYFCNKCLFLCHALAYNYDNGFFTLRRLKWIIQQSTKYSKSDYLLVSWQDDDLPIFGRVDDIVIVSDYCMFCVNVYFTLGIDRHYHSFSLKRTPNIAVYFLSELPDYHAYQAHSLSNGQLYITFKSYVEKIV